MASSADAQPILPEEHLAGEDTVPGEYVLAVNTSCMESVGMGERLRGLVESWPKRGLASGTESEEMTLKIKTNKRIDQLRLELTQEACLVAAAPNIRLRTQALPMDPLVSQQRHLSSASINYSQAYDLFFESPDTLRAEIVVAVIDDGVDINHQDLQSNIWVNAAERDGQAGVDDDGNGYIDDISGYDFVTGSGNPSPKAGSSHGTHVAGLIGAEASNGFGGIGVMPARIKLMALNIFGSQNFTDPVYLDAAIRYAADNGADVINLSVGGRGRTPSTILAINYALQKGAVVIAAAGNDGRAITNNDFFAPAGYAPDYAGFLSVGASDVAQNNELCGFSNFGGNYVEIAAPGCDGQNSLGLVSTAQNNQYIRFMGTSMASPIVAGSAALAMSYLKTHTPSAATPARVESILKQQARGVASYNGRIADNKHLDLLGLYNGLVGFVSSLAADSVCP